MKFRVGIVLLCLVILVALLVTFELLVIKFNGKPVAVPTIPRSKQVFGAGKPLTYVVMGDSTSVGQGTTYDKSYALQTAQHLATSYRVSLTNVGVSGARAKDVTGSQLAKAKSLQPDLVLLSVGANDATHFTSSRTVRASLQKTIDGLRQASPDVKIVVTGSPQMGSVPRFPWPARQLAGLRTKQINNVYASLIAQNNLYFAPIAAETGQAFAADPTLFAQDKFHPDARGYALWTPVINRAIDEALSK